jgi:hypothetical protein
MPDSRTEQTATESIKEDGEVEIDQSTTVLEKPEAEKAIE